MKRALPDGRASDPIIPGKICPARGHAYKLIRFDNVPGQAPAVDTAGVQTNRVRRQPRSFRRPMTKEDDSSAAIDVVPGYAAAAGRIRTHGSHLGQINGHLPSQVNT